MQAYWLKQTDKPLFPDILWSRPEHRQAAGKLLIVGGNVHSFINVGLSYQAAVQAGAGTVRVLLPDALRKTVGATLENCEFAPSTPSGSFAKTALSELLAEAQWADCVLLAGDFGRSSETAIVLEQFVQNYSGLLVVAHDALDYFFGHPELILDRAQTGTVGSVGQLQKLAQASHFTQAITSSLDLVRFVEILHDFAALHQSYLVTHHLDTTVVTAHGMVSTTKINNGPNPATAAVFLMQNPAKPFEALTTSFAQ
jgi:hypothetical protein